MYRRNVAGQVVYGTVKNLSTGFAETTGVAIYVSKDGGAAAAGTGTLANIRGALWAYTFTQAETDAAAIGYIFEKSGAVGDGGSIRTVQCNGDDPVRLGLTALPNATAGASGGVYVVGGTGVSLADNAITSTKFAAQSITAAALATDALSAITGSVWSFSVRALTDKVGYTILDNTITNLSFASNAIDSRVLATSGAAKVWTTARSGNQTAGTFGEYVDAAISTRSTFAGGAVASVTAPVTVGTVTDKTGYSLAASQTFSTTGSVGSVTTLAADAITAAAFATGSITAAALAADAISAAAFSQAAANKAWATPARVLTAGTNIVLAKGTGVTGFNDITAASVWGVARSGNAASGTFGEFIDASIASRLPTTQYAATELSPAAVAAAVWDAGTNNYGNPGSYGALLEQNLDARMSSRLAQADYVAAPAASAVAQAVWSRDVTDGFGPNTAAVELVQAAGGAAAAAAVWTYENRTVASVANIAPQSGDAAALLGAPANDSLAADLVELKALVEAIKAKTDALRDLGVAVTVAGTATRTSVPISGQGLSTAANAYMGYMVFLDGALKGQAQQISAYVGTSDPKVITLAQPLVAPPQVGDRAVLVGRNNRVTA